MACSIGPAFPSCQASGYCSAMQKGAACSENARKYFGDSDQRAGVDSDNVGFVKNKMVGHFLALIAIVSLVET